MALPEQTTGSSLHSPLASIAATELRMGVRSGVFRVVAVLLFAIGWSAGNTDGHGVGMSAYAAGEIACLYLGIVTVVWVALGAVRDTVLHTDLLVFTKPQPPERLALARFIGLYGQILFFIAALFAGAALSKLVAGGSIAGIAAYGIQYFRAAGALFFAAAGSYCLALLADSAIAGILVGLYWVVAIAGHEYLAKYYYPWYIQNLPAYVFFGVGLLCFALWFTRRRQRGERLAAPAVRILAPVAMLIGAFMMLKTIRTGHDVLAVQNPAMERMSLQNIVEGQLTPGLLLPDQHGKGTSLSQFGGKILLIALWSPEDPDSPALLDRIAAAYKQFGAQGVQPIAICMSEDASAHLTFAIGDEINYPLVYDWGTSHGERQMESSPLALAYQAVHLPRVVITDRRHRVRNMLDGLYSYQGPELDNYIRLRLTDEPD
jgi:hypothetical protein